MAKKILSISTKTGDKGQTGLANGQRLSKADPVFGVIGNLDELNSWLGLVAAKLNHQFPEHGQYLYEIQDTLFIIGAELAHSPKIKLTAVKLVTLEKTAQGLQESLADDWHTKFLLPGGTEFGGYLDVARTVCRRAERSAVEYSKNHQISELVLKYLNRLSDYLFILRCFVNNAVEYQEQEFIAEK